MKDGTENGEAGKRRCEELQQEAKREGEESDRSVGEEKLTLDWFDVFPQLSIAAEARMKANSFIHYYYITHKHIHNTAIVQTSFAFYFKRERHSIQFNSSSTKSWER